MTDLQTQTWKSNSVRDRLPGGKEYLQRWLEPLFAYENIRHSRVTALYRHGNVRHSRRNVYCVRL